MSESEERLRRVEILLETCAKVTVSNQAEIKELRERSDAERAELRHQLASLSAMFTESVRIMQGMQSEIKGLQTENKRILDHLFGESQN